MLSFDSVRDGLLLLPLLPLLVKVPPVLLELPSAKVIALALARRPPLCSASLT